jgi:hypothetical protein
VKNPDAFYDVHLIFFVIVSTRGKFICTVYVSVIQVPGVKIGL